MFPTWGPQSLPVGYQFSCEIRGTDRKHDTNASCMASSSAVNASPTQGTEAHWNGAGSARLDERQHLLTTQGLSCCSETCTHPQPSPELGAHLCTSSIPLPLTSCMVHRAEAHGVGRSPPPTLAIRRQERYRHLNSNSLKISTSKGDTSRTSFGATLHHKNKTADHGPIPVENLESLALSLSHGRLNIYLIGKVLKGTESHP